MQHEITEFRNAKYFNEVAISCEVKHPEMGWIPYACNPEDKVGGIDNSKLYPLLVSSRPTPYVPPTEEEIALEEAVAVRNLRNLKLLHHVDPIVSNPLRWGEMSEEEKQKVQSYRKLLLDIPQQEGFPYKINWPEKDF